MNRSGAVGVGVIGAGVISSAYLENLTQFPDIEVLFVADIDLDRAKTQAQKFGVSGHGSVDELLAIDEIEIVVNLTVPAAHAAVGHRILAAGKHAWSEKPFALDLESGRALLDDANARGLRVACAPDTFLGAGLQSAQRLLDSGRIGAGLSGIALCQSPGPESWHPNPEFLFDIGAGPLFDLGPYYLTAFVQMFGPVARVSAVSSTARATRTIGSGPKAGTDFVVNVPTQYSAILEFEAGQSAILVLSFESEIERTQIELTGVDGSLALPDPNQFAGPTVVSTRHLEAPEIVAEEGAAYGRGTGVLDLARSIRAGVPERAEGSLAFHVLDIMVSIAEAAETRSAIEVTSTAARPANLPAGWNPTAATL
jgi:predicted dehydrogenase